MNPRIETTVIVSNLKALAARADITPDEIRSLRLAVSIIESQRVGTWIDVAVRGWERALEELDDTRAR